MILVFDICGGMALRRRERRPGAPGDTRRAATIAGPSSAATALPLPPPSSVPGITIREAADATARGVPGRPVGVHGPPSGTSTLKRRVDDGRAPARVCAPLTHVFGHVYTWFYTGESGTGTRCTPVMVRRRTCPCEVRLGHRRRRRPLRATARTGTCAAWPITSCTLWATSLCTFPLLLTSSSHCRASLQVPR